MEIPTMEFFNPSVVFKGAVRADNAPSNDSDLTRKQDIAGLSYISAIASGSQSMLSVSNGELSISSLAVTDVHVDSTQTSLANFVANESSTAQGLGTGDVLILTAPSAGTETYIVSGANGGSVGNYTQIESPITAAEIGSVIQAGDGISINASTAQISANIAAGTALSSSVSNGQITLAFSGSSDDVVEGSSNEYFTQARARGAISVESVSQPDANLLQYNSSTGALKVLLSDVLSEFSAGTALSYNNGQFSFSGTTSDVAEGSNEYFTQARARGAISADIASGNLLQYNSSTGELLVATADVQGAFSGGTAISISSGTIAFSGNTDNVAEGSTNEYFTPGRARGAVAVSNQSDELISYNNSNGEFSLRLSSLRYEAQVTLTANTPYTITHNLGKKLVHVSAMDSSGNKIQLNVVYSSTSALTVESVSGVTVDVAVSL
jgi:hypothetical protein